MSDKELREGLVERLTDSGHLRTHPWREAVSAVPRHEFLRGGFFQQVEGSPDSVTSGSPTSTPLVVRRFHADEEGVSQGLTV
ncbi:hypothetical protein [Streptomyces tailanensis]|uniref:hypothetical protein n=1 Tax=Streptomyces tailanensis TaxID=2569858 RepID=UPI00122E7447|nr:hypothetical protein [Streptomyces tailanensis]